MKGRKPWEGKDIGVAAASMVIIRLCKPVVCGVAEAQVVVPDLLWGTSSCRGGSGLLCERSDLDSQRHVSVSQVNSRCLRCRC